MNSYNEYTIIINGEKERPKYQLSDSVIFLILDDKFDKPIDFLPKFIDYLELKDNFYGTFESIPNTLRHIKIHYDVEYFDINHDFIDKLPKSLTFLDIGELYSDSFNYLPSLLGLTHLIIRGETIESFNQSIDNLPQSLISLEILSILFYKRVNKLPDSLKELTIYCKFLDQINLICLPEKLTHLKIYNIFNQEINCLPRFLTSLIIYVYEFNQEVNNLPLGLKTLFIISENFNKTVDNIPDSVINLGLPITFTQQIFNLPLSVLNIYRFNMNICCLFPIETIIDNTKNTIINQLHILTLSDMCCDECCDNCCVGCFGHIDRINDYNGFNINIDKSIIDRYINYSFEQYNEVDETGELLCKYKIDKLHKLKIIKK